MRYEIVPIILADEPDLGPPLHWPGLYALDLVESESVNRFEAFLITLQDVEYLKSEVWVRTSAEFKQLYPTFELFHEALQDQWQHTAALLTRYAKAGYLRDALFLNLKLGKQQEQPEKYSLEVKHKSSHSPAFWDSASLPFNRVSLIRLLGVQFGPGIVVVTGGGIKTTGGSHQNDPQLKQRFQDAIYWAYQMTNARRDPVDISFFIGETFDIA